MGGHSHPVSNILRIETLTKICTIDSLQRQIPARNVNIRSPQEQTAIAVPEEEIQGLRSQQQCQTRRHMVAEDTLLAMHRRILALRPTDQALHFSHLCTRKHQISQYYNDATDLSRQHPKIRWPNEYLAP